MTYKELKSKVSKKTGVDTTTVSKVIDETFAVIKEELINDGRLHIPFFGIFHTKEKKARKIRTFKGQIKEIPAKKVPAFAFSKSLKKEVEENAKKKSNN